MVIKMIIYRHSYYREGNLLCEIPSKEWRPSLNKPSAVITVLGSTSSPSRHTHTCVFVENSSTDGFATTLLGSVEVQQFCPSSLAFIRILSSHTAHRCFVSVGVPMVTASLIFQAWVKWCLATVEVTPSSTTQVTAWLLQPCSFSLRQNYVESIIKSCNIYVMSLVDGIPNSEFQPVSVKFNRRVHFTKKYVIPALLLKLRHVFEPLVWPYFFLCCKQSTRFKRKTDVKTASRCGDLKRRPLL